VPSRSTGSSPVRGSVVHRVFYTGLRVVYGGILVLKLSVGVGLSNVGVVWQIANPHRVI
jgi:hypothetical protein